MDSPGEETREPRRKKILVVELWGLGDLTFSTPFLREAIKEHDVTLLAKPYARDLLHPSFASLRFIGYNAPWTAFRRKYDLFRWDWKNLWQIVWQLRREHFDVAVSVRNDPRDHFLMALSGARERYGFSVRCSEIFLTHPLTRKKKKQHKVEDWREIGLALDLPGVASNEPGLRAAGYFSVSVADLFSKITKPVFCLHTGARFAVRRWPEAYFAHIVKQLRSRFDFHFILIPDTDGYGSALAPLADTFIRTVSVRDLTSVLCRCDLLLCNDSGPGHIAAACGRPVVAVFGPGDPVWFHPWGEESKIVIRDICPWRPCFDYCKFKEPYCMTKLLPETVWPEIHQHILSLISRQCLPATLVKKVPMTSTAVLDKA